MRRASTEEELKRIQEESASPFLREGVVGVKANNNKEKISDHLHLDKEKEGHTSVGAYDLGLLHHLYNLSQDFIDVALVCDDARLTK